MLAVATNAKALATARPHANTLIDLLTSSYAQRSPGSISRVGPRMSIFEPSFFRTMQKSPKSFGSTAGGATMMKTTEEDFRTLSSVDPLALMLLKPGRQSNTIRC